MTPFEILNTPLLESTTHSLVGSVLEQSISSTDGFEKRKLKYLAALKLFGLKTMLSSPRFFGKSTRTSPSQGERTPARAIAQTTHMRHM